MRTAGYSGTPLHKKLGIKPGHTVLMLGAPREITEFLAAQEPAAEFKSRASAKQTYEIVLYFSKSFADLKPYWKKFGALIEQNGTIWVAWPKKSSGVKTDLSEDVVRESGIRAGFVDVKICAIDETWSGHKFVIPLKNRK